MLYRLPHGRQYTRIVPRTPVHTYQTLHDVPLQGGYVVMPFVVTPDCPILFFDGEGAVTQPVPDSVPAEACIAGPTDEAAERSRYAEAFGRAHRLLCEGSLEKIVLSRRLHVSLTAPADAERLFFNACHSRPASFVALWSAPRSGTWLVATPEPLLTHDGHRWRTVALAGTLPCPPDGAEPEWNGKNRREQAIVAEYIAGRLSQAADGVTASPTYTLRSGNICHLCTDFRFSLPSGYPLAALLARLHPTPAVCGMPGLQALRAILDTESTGRLYYGGFSGPLCLGSEPQRTHLYVSLRCMQTEGRSATLYAGGGIMPESREQDEWEETQRKLQTMRSLL